jgi:hypothetical protein
LGSVFEGSNPCQWWVSVADLINPTSAMKRETFELRISNTKYSACILNDDDSIKFCWYDNATFPQPLNFQRAVVQFQHHSYNPEKGSGPSGGTDTGRANTWHWDEFYLSDSVPFTLVRARERYFINSGTFTFNTPAPANSYVRFTAIGDVIKINGQTVQPQVTKSHDEHFSSYLVPIPEGSTSVTYQGTGGWYGDSMAKDISIFSQTVEGGQTPTNTPAPPTPTPQPQNPTPTNTPVPNQPTPTPLPKLSNLLLSPPTGSFSINQTFSVEVRVNTNGQSVNGVETTISFSSQRLSVESVTNGTFEVEAQKVIGTNSVTLAYGTTTPKTGNQLVATINFKALSAGSANLTLSNSSVISNISNGDVLNTATGATYSIVSQPTATPTPLPPTPTPTKTPQQKADINSSGSVDIQDLSYLLSHWNTNDALADINGDGNVTILDLSILLSHYGT